MKNLEGTIHQIISERKRNADPVKSQPFVKQAIDPKKRKYAKEFNSLYRRIGSVEQIEVEFIAWVDRCKIDDEKKEVVDGKSFYQRLLTKARSAYERFREEGYEPQAAFDKGTEGLTTWIQDSYEKASGGTIYLNYPASFLSRMRKAAEW